MEDNVQDPTDNSYPAEAKPEKSEDHINLKVKSQDGNEVFFKIKRTTPMRKLMTAYCSRQGLQIDSMRFIFEGERLKLDDTPELREMVDGDEIDVFISQDKTRWKKIVKAHTPDPVGKPPPPKRRRRFDE
eukprot:jgi/Mesvir1/27262/Mv07099-RA.1